MSSPYERYPGRDGADGLPVFSSSQAGLSLIGPCPLCPASACRRLPCGYQEMPTQGTLICRHGLRWWSDESEAAQ